MIISGLIIFHIFEKLYNHMIISNEELEIECFLEDFRRFQWAIQEFRIQFPYKKRYSKQQCQKAKKMLDYIIETTNVSDLQFLEFVMDSIDELFKEYKELFL